MDTTFLKEAKNTPSRKLPDSVRSNFIDRGYHEVNEARVHLDDVNTRAMNSIAFTYGNDIFVQNNYANNENVLSHEMGHVVQQMRVGVSPDSASTLINSSSSMENQANEIAFGDLEVSSGGSAGKSVQRLMSLGEFQKRTKTFFGKRNKIKNIEAELEYYNNFVNNLPTDARHLIRNPEALVNTLKSMLENLYSECNNYQLEGGKRDITALRIQIVEEENILNQILQVHETSKRLISKETYKEETTYERLREAQRKDRKNLSQGALIRARYFATHCRDDIFYKYKNIKFCEKLDGAFEDYLMNADIATLIEDEAYTNSYQEMFQNVIADENAPQGLRDVLSETMEFAGNVPVGGGMKSARKYKDGTYAITFGAANEDSTISAGSYLHELTHVNVGESYGNTAMFLGLCEDDDYGDLFQERTEGVRNLAKKISEELQFVKEGRSPFTEKQLISCLVDKLKYGAYKDNKVYSTYINRYKKFQAPDHELEGISEEKADSLEGKFKDAMGSQEGINFGEEGIKFKFGEEEKDTFLGVASNVFVEYDAVINQMLMWCYGWGIPKDNPVVVALDALVRREIGRRAAARAQRGIDLRNINRR